MSWDLLLTSDILGLYKPNPQTYKAVLSALGLRPDECAMVAAHVYDLNAAKAL